jgi:hypothetical protein
MQYVAPTGLEIFGSQFYKDAAPTVLENRGLPGRG